MGDAAIQPIVMPKWGLAMQEGMVAHWHVEEGAPVAKGQEIVDIETSKIANVFESPASGTLRRRVAAPGETLPVGALLGVLAEESVADAEVDAFVADFQERLNEQLAAQSQAKGPEFEFAEVDGRRLRYLRAGEGGADPVLFLHGYGGDLNNWLFNQPAVAERAPTFALDLPGHGGSAKDVGEGTVAALAGTVAGFMDAVGIGRAHLVGHSLGGAIALRLALDHPGRVASATLVCPAGLGPEISMAYVDGFIEAGRRRKMEPVLQMLVADPATVTGDMIEDVLRFKRLDGVDAALRKLREGLFRDGRQALVLKDRLGEVRCPVQVVWGRQDRIIPAAQADGLAGTVDLAILDDAGHLAHMEKAKEVNELILARIG